MRQLIVRYRLRPDQVETNERLVRAVYDELRTARATGIRYATFRADDGVTFLHLASIEDEAGRRALPDLPAFQAFIADLAARCVEQPVTTELTAIGSYRAFGDQDAGAPS